jgi:rapamycin-insensitive companion of mTOR
VSPKTFPLCLSKSLRTLIFWNDDATKKAAIEIIRILALQNTEICEYGGGIRILCEAIVDPTFEIASKVITNTIIYLLNSPETRDCIIQNLQIPRIFSMFTDIDRSDFSQKAEEQNVFETKLRLASNAILIFFKSWPGGLIYLGDEKISIKSLIEALRQPVKPIIREYIFQLFDEILKTGVSLCPQEQENPSDPMRRSLAQSAYIQTKLLKEARLYDVLLELSSVDSPEIAMRAQSQLKLFSHMMYHLIPLEEVKKPDFLMNSINLDETQFDYLRAKCSTIFENMNTKLVNKRKSKKFKNEFLYKCEYFYLNMTYTFADNRYSSFKSKDQSRGRRQDQVSR